VAVRRQKSGRSGPDRVLLAYTAIPKTFDFQLTTDRPGLEGEIHTDALFPLECDRFAKARSEFVAALSPAMFMDHTDRLAAELYGFMFVTIGSSRRPSVPFAERARVRTGQLRPHLGRAPRRLHFRQSLFRPPRPGPGQIRDVAPGPSGERIGNSSRSLIRLLASLYETRAGFQTAGLSGLVPQRALTRAAPHAGSPT
jgi:hypothetical protein